MSAQLLVGAAALQVMPSRGAIQISSAILALGIGWGWSGLLAYSVVHRFPMQPGAASALVMTVAGGVGSAVGPFLMGLTIERVGYGSTERLWSGLFLAAALVVVVIRASLERRSISQPIVTT